MTAALGTYLRGADNAWHTGRKTVSDKVTAAASLAGLSRVGSTLSRKLSGVNAYWLGLDDNAGTSTGSFPSRPTITAAFDGMQAMGVNLVRAHTVGMSAGTPLSYLTGYSGTTPQYNEANLDSADWAVYQAGLHGVVLMTPLTDNWNYYHGGLWNFVHWAYQQNSAGITDVNGSVKDDQNQREFFRSTAAGLRIRALFKDYILHWLNHVNPYTGLAYKDDPTIAIVETGNEIYYAAQLGTNEWTQDIASYIKSIAPNKLVADGSAASGQATSTMPGLTAAAVDIVGGHYYPQDPSNGYAATTFSATASSFPAGSARQQLAADVTAATGAAKAFILGEYPWTRSDVTAWYSDIEANVGIDADMAWAYIAGTEVHGGSFGSDDFSIHYPYLAGNESTYGPALTAHIKAKSAYGSRTPMPVGDLANFTAIVSENYAAPLVQGDTSGATVETVYPNHRAYDRFSLDTSKNGTYDPSPNTIYQQMYDGVDCLVLHCHYEPSSGNYRTAFVAPNGYNAQVYGKWTWRMCTPAGPNVNGYKIVPLTWPGSNVYGDGEWDFPENNQGDATGSINSFLHDANTTTPSHADGWSVPALHVADWHIYDIEWTPTYANFSIDGVVYKTITPTHNAWPPAGFRWGLQAETGNTAQGSTPPPTTSYGKVYVDWIKVYTYNPPLVITDNGNNTRTFSSNDPTVVVDNGDGTFKLNSPAVVLNGTDTFTATTSL